MGSVTMTETRTPTDVVDMEARWEAIQLKLQANVEVLASRGTLVAKMASGRRLWVVRYFVQEEGRRVHKSIYVGGDDVPELLDRVGHLLEEYRLQGRWAEEVEGYARIAARAGNIVRRLASGRGRSS